MPFRRAFAMAAVSLVGQAAIALGAITYIDATASNTVLQGGASLVPGSNCTTGPGDGAMDNLWHLRTGVGNGGGVWTADESSAGSEDPAALVTTITFPEPGSYRVFAYIWDSDEPAQEWDVKARIGTNGFFSSIQASESEPADPAAFSSTLVTFEAPRRLIQVPLGVVVAVAGGSVVVTVEDDADSERTWYDGVGYERAFGSVGERLIAIDFNKTNVPGTPVQAMFRGVNGSSTASVNSTNISRVAGAYGVQITKSNTARFEFQGPNGDSTRIIPGGPTGLSFLLADFIASKDGLVRLTMTNLPAGSYLFRSYHLESLNASGFGYAQGTNSLTPNVIQARVGGALKALVQPTAVGLSGLGTTFISDADAPTISLVFAVESGMPATIDLSSIYANGSTRYIFLNGFEVFSTTP